MKTLLIILLLAIPVLAQPDLSRYEVVGTSDDTAFLVSKDRTTKKHSIEFSLIIAQAAMGDDGLALNPNNYMMATVIGNCSEMTYKAGKKTGKKNGEDYAEDASKERPAPIDSRIWQVLTFVCKPPPGLRA